MTTELTKVTPEEIAKFRAELADYPNPKAIAALDEIEECEGYLEDAIPLLVPAIEPISMGAGIPPGVATAIGICAFKLGMKKVCAGCDA